MTAHGTPIRSMPSDADAHAHSVGCRELPIYNVRAEADVIIEAPHGHNSRKGPDAVIDMPIALLSKVILLPPKTRRATLSEHKEGFRLG
jgi:hypothetical protein